MVTRHSEYGGTTPADEALAGRTRWGWILAMLAPLALFATAARAAEPPKLRVLALHVDGVKLALLDREALSDAIRAKLELYPTIALVEAPSSEITDEMIELECIDLDAECLTKLGEKYGADRVIHTEVNHKVKVAELKLRVVDVTKGAIAHEKILEAKTAPGLAPLLDAELEVPFGPPPKIVKKGTLVVETSPKASIFLGADLVGTGRAQLELEPGVYTVRVSEAGYNDAIKEFTVASEQTTTEKVTLVAIPKPPVTAPPKTVAKSDSTWVLWAVVGAVVLGGTVAAIAIGADSGDSVVRGPALLGVDASSAWRDPVTFGGRQ
jgi:hypothetical protein